MIFTNSIYWINPAWNFYRVFGRIYRIVGAIRSGLVSAVRDFFVFVEGIINPSAVVVENSWSATGTTSISFSLTLPSVANAYLCVCCDGTYSVGNGEPTSFTWNGITLAKTAAAANSQVGRKTVIYGAVIPAGSLNATSNLVSVAGTGSPNTLQVTVYLCSGVHQTTPVVSAAVSTYNTANASVLLSAAVANGMALECGCSDSSTNSGFGVVTSPQIPYPSVALSYGSSMATSGVTSVGRTFAGATSSCEAALALQPA